MTPRLQRVLDAFTIPAIIRTASWDVIATECAGGVVLTDYSQLPLAERNVLRRLFTRPEARCTLEDWQRVGLSSMLPRRRHADGRHERN